MLQRLLGITRGIVSRLERRSAGQALSEEPQSWLMRAIRGGPGRAGVAVTHDAALSSTAMYQGIRLISEIVASVPLKLYRNRPGAALGKDVVSTHRVHTALHDEPNPEQTAFELRAMVQAHALLFGTGFIYVVWDESGYPMELWPVTPHRVTPMRAPNGQLWWAVRTPQGENRRVHADDLIPIRGFTLDGVLGVDVVRMMRESIGLTLATEAFGAQFFGNGTNLSGVLSHPGKVGKDTALRLRESWEDLHSGLDNSHRVAILEEGITWTATGIPPEASQMLQTRKFQITEVARILNLPPHLLRDLERATFSNVEQQSIEFVTLTLTPWFIRWEQALKKYLLSDREKVDHVIKHVLAGLVRGDIKTRYAAYAIGRQWGWLCADDICEMEDRNPLPDGQGQVYLVATNMASAASVADDDTREDDDRRYDPAL